MLELLLAIFLGFASPSYNTNDNNSTNTTATTPDPGPGPITGGDGSNIPPGRPQ